MKISTLVIGGIIIFLIGLFVGIGYMKTIAAPVPKVTAIEQVIPQQGGETKNETTKPETAPTTPIPDAPVGD